MRNKLFVSVLITILGFCAFASSISFVGGYSEVSFQDGKHTVLLSNGADIKTDDIQLTADSVFLYGDDYCYVDCTGKVNAYDIKNNITLDTTNLFYDRKENNLIADGWITIDDPDDKADLSGSWLEYNLDTQIMVIQMMATITKETDDGLMECKADSISFNCDTQMVTLRGNAKVDWGDDHYAASVITVNLDTEEITLHGTITGEVNG